MLVVPSMCVVRDILVVARVDLGGSMSIRKVTVLMRCVRISYCVRIVARVPVLASAVAVIVLMLHSFASRSNSVISPC